MTETSSGLGRMPQPLGNELPPIAPPYCSEEDMPARTAAGEQLPLREPFPRRVQTSGGWDPDDL